MKSSAADSVVAIRIAVGPEPDSIPLHPATHPPQIVVCPTRSGNGAPLTGEVVKLTLFDCLTDDSIDVGLESIGR